MSITVVGIKEKLAFVPIVHRISSILLNLSPMVTLAGLSPLGLKRPMYRYVQVSPRLKSVDCGPISYSL